MNNKDVREAATNAGVKLWQIAEKLNINDGNFSRKLRREFTAEEKERVFNIIREIAEAGEE